MWGHPHVKVTELTIGNPARAGGGQMVSVQRIDLELRFWPLLRGEIVPQMRREDAGDLRESVVLSRASSWLTYAASDI